MDRPVSFLGRRRQNVWANIVFVSALGVLFVTAGGPLKIVEPWAESVRQPVNMIGAIEVTAEREYLSYESTPVESDHLMFGIEDGPATEDRTPTPELGGAWLHARTGTKCGEAPELSIRLRESDESIYGYGLVAPTACGSHRPEELDYTIVQGRRKDGVIVFTILEKTEGRMLYRFEGSLAEDGLVGKLAQADGNAIADGLVFSPDPDVDDTL